jgi:P27 family predicted phage terminase small subunit
MGLRGPPPKPTALRLVPGGNPSRRPLPDAEPIPPAGAPEPPDFLDETSRQIWKQLVPGLAAVGLARSIDGTALGRYCSLLALWIQALTFVRNSGSTYAVRAAPTADEARARKEGRILGFREFPQAGQLRRLGQQLMVLEREFGLTPAARTRIRVQQEAAAGGDVNALKRQFFGAPSAG